VVGVDAAGCGAATLCVWLFHVTSTVIGSVCLSVCLPVRIVSCSCVWSPACVAAVVRFDLIITRCTLLLSMFLPVLTRTVTLLLLLLLLLKSLIEVVVLMQTNPKVKNTVTKIAYCRRCSEYI